MRFRDTEGEAGSLAERVRKLAAAGYADLSFSWRDLERHGASGGFSGAELACGASLLRLEGEMRLHRSPDGAVKYSLTQEAVARCHETELRNGPASREEGDGGTAEEEEGVSGYGLPDGLASELFFRFLREIALNRLRLEREGEWPDSLLRRYRRAVFGVNGEPGASDGGGPYADDRSAGTKAVLGFFLSAAVELGLLRPEKRDWRLQPERLSRWLRLPPFGMEDKLYKLWMKRGVPQVPLLRHAMLLYDRHLPRNRVSGGEMQLLGGLAADSEVPPNERVERVREEILNPLCLLGWGFRAGGEYRLSLPVSVGQPLERRLEAAGTVEEEGGDEGGTEWYVQPDLEVIPARISDYAQLWELALFAEPVGFRLDEAWRLTERSWRNALRHGRKAEECLSLLEGFSLNGIPESVRRQAEEWTKEWTKEWETFARKAAAESAGASSRKPVPESSAYPRSTALNERTYGDPESEAFLPPSDGTRMDRQELIPGPDELFPGWRDIPAAWHRECRPYHRSTALKLAICARDWKTFLAIVENEESAILVPSAVLEEGGRIRLEGRTASGERRIGLEPGTKLQILLPDAGVSWYDRKKFIDLTH